MTRHLEHRLHGQHALLEVALAQEIRRPQPDERTLKNIKRRKLLVKDRLQALKSKAATDGLMPERRFSGVHGLDAIDYGALRLRPAALFHGSGS